MNRDAVVSLLSSDEEDWGALDERTKLPGKAQRRTHEGAPRRITFGREHDVGINRDSPSQSVALDTIPTPIEPAVRHRDPGVPHPRQLLVPEVGSSTGIEQSVLPRREPHEIAVGDQTPDRAGGAIRFTEMPQVWPRQCGDAGGPSSRSRGPGSEAEDENAWRGPHSGRVREQPILRGRTDIGGKPLDPWEVVGRLHGREREQTTSRVLLDPTAAPPVGRKRGVEASLNDEIRPTNSEEVKGEQAGGDMNLGGRGADSDSEDGVEFVAAHVRRRKRKASAMWEFQFDDEDDDDEPDDAVTSVDDDAGCANDGILQVSSGDEADKARTRAPRPRRREFGRDLLERPPSRIAGPRYVASRRALAQEEERRAGRERQERQERRRNLMRQSYLAEAEEVHLRDPYGFAAPFDTNNVLRARLAGLDRDVLPLGPQPRAMNPFPVEARLRTERVLPVRPPTALAQNGIGIAAPEDDDDDDDDDDIEPMAAGSRALVPQNAGSGGGLWRDVKAEDLCTLLAFALPWVEGKDIERIVGDRYKEFRMQSLWDCAVALLGDFPAPDPYVNGSPAANESLEGKTSAADSHAGSKNSEADVIDADLFMAKETMGEESAVADVASRLAKEAPACGLVSKDVAEYIALRVKAYISRDLLAADISAITAVDDGCGDDGMTCALCYDDYKAEHVVTCCGSEHNFCRECFGSYVVKTHIENRQSSDLYSVACIDPSCKELFDIFDVEANLNSYALFLVREKAEEKARNEAIEAVGGTKFSCVCGIIAVVDENHGEVTCPGCGDVYCLRCKHKYHGKDPCPPPKKIAKLLKTDRDLARCPACGEGISRTGGCNHLTCVCGKHFCCVCSKGYVGGQYSHVDCDSASYGRQRMEMLERFGPPFARVGRPYNLYNAGRIMGRGMGGADPFEDRDRFVNRPQTLRALRAPYGNGARAVAEGGARRIPPLAERIRIGEAADAAAFAAARAAADAATVLGNLREVHHHHHFHPNDDNEQRVLRLRHVGRRQVDRTTPAAPGRFDRAHLPATNDDRFTIVDGPLGGAQRVGHLNRTHPAPQHRLNHPGVFPRVDVSVRRREDPWTRRHIDPLAPGGLNRVPLPELARLRRAGPPPGGPPPRMAPSAAFASLRNWEEELRPGEVSYMRDAVAPENMRDTIVREHMHRESVRRENVRRENLRPRIMPGLDNFNRAARDQTLYRGESPALERLMRAPLLSRRLGEEASSREIGRRAAAAEFPARRFTEAGIARGHMAEARAAEARAAEAREVEARAAAHAAAWRSHRDLAEARGVEARAVAHAAAHAAARRSHREFTAAYGRMYSKLPPF